MARNKGKRDPIPEQFKSVEEAGEFWDSHDLGDYWDLTSEAYFETKIQTQAYITALEPGLARKLTECARTQGISTETLINVWLNEKLQETARTK